MVEGVISLARRIENNISLVVAGCWRLGVKSLAVEVRLTCNTSLSSMSLIVRSLLMSFLLLSPILISPLSFDDEDDEEYDDDPSSGEE